MATLNVLVDSTVGNYEQVFIYTLNASFNGVEGDIKKAEIRIFFPSTLDVFLGDYRDPVKNVIENITEDGTELIYEFGSITDLGLAVRLGIGVQFKRDTPNLTKFLCEAKLFINGDEFLVSSGDEISLLVVGDFELRRQVVLPAVDPSPGSEVYYKAILQNFGDLGASLQSVTIVCNGSDKVQLDDSFTVKGYDRSSNFNDKSADEIVGSISNNTLTFSIPKYSGERYEFIYKTLVSAEATLGAELVTEATWSLDETIQQTEFHDLTLGDKVYDAAISIYGPDYTLPSEYICYTMSIENTGNQILTAAVFTDELPQEVDYYRFTTGTFSIAAIDENLSAEYNIGYKTTYGLEGVLGPYNTDINSSVELSEILADDDSLSELKWNLTALNIGVKSRTAPSLFGIVKPDTTINSSLLNHIHLVYDEEAEQSERIQNFSTIVDDICSLYPTLSLGGGATHVRPGDSFEVNVNVNCIRSRLKNPVVAVLLPKDLLYKGNITADYNDVFGSITPTLPDAVVIENFTESMQTLVKFEFSNEFEFSFRQLTSINLSFDVEVAIGAYGEMSTFCVLNTDGSTGIIPTNVDVYIDQDGISDSRSVSKTYAKSGTRKKNVLFFVSTSSNKKVKGALDNTYVEEPLTGKTYEGGKVQYLISLKNIGNSDLLDAEIVDILPHIGDTGVIETQSPRNSDFSVYSLSEINARILPENRKTGIDIYYSSSNDPVRFGPNFDIIGTDDDWQTEAPEDLSTLRSFKVLASDAVLKPAETLELSVNAIIPVGAKPDMIAWNSFAADVSYIDLSGNKQKMLAVEPEKVGIEVTVTEPDKVQIGGFVWYDTQSDGYYTEGEPLMNDTGVALLSESGEILDAVFTAPDAEGNEGKYLFSNLPRARYYIKFFIDNTKFKYSTRRLDSENGSKANTKTGMSPIIDLTSAPSALRISAAVIDKDKITLDSVLKANKSARSMVRDVVKNQMLLVMKQEDIISLIQDDKLF